MLVARSLRGARRIYVVRFDLDPDVEDLMRAGPRRHRSSGLGQKRSERLVDGGIRRHDRGTRIVPNPLEARGASSSLAHDEDPGLDIPGVDAGLEVPIESASRHPREIERGRAKATEVAHSWEYARDR